MIKTSHQPLRLTPYAWAKLLYLRDQGSTEVGGFGISSASDLLLVEDICLIKQSCTEVTVRLDDQAVADFFDTQVDAGLPLQRFARIWVHTHPGKSAHPSTTDESAFQRCFGKADWALMFIVARGGQTYARLRLNAGPGGNLELPSEVDFAPFFPAAAPSTWRDEYERCIQIEQPLAAFSLSDRIPADGVPQQRRDPPERPAPFLADPWWDDQAFNTYMESLDDRDRHPF
jgi:hypothetical protein